jgi:hypothetical protein
MKTTRTNRTGDAGSREYFRSDRFVCEKGLWYFLTREKALEGPFASRKCAEQYLRTHIALANIASGFDAELVPLEGEKPKTKSAQGTKPWITDPFHKRLGSAA